jgi:hypothetical protein
MRFLRCCARRSLESKFSVQTASLCIGLPGYHPRKPPYALKSDSLDPVATDRLQNVPEDDVPLDRSFGGEELA